MIGNLWSAILVWLAVVIVYDAFFQFDYRRRVRPYRYWISDHMSGAKIHGLAANLTYDGHLRKKTVVVRLGWVVPWNWPNALDTLEKFMKAYPECSVFVPFPPGFGGTTHPRSLFTKKELEEMASFAPLAHISARAMFHNGVREVILVGASMGANIAAWEGIYVSRYPNFRVIRYTSMVGVIEEMDVKELRKRFTGLKTVIDRLAVKWWEKGIPFSTRLATRGVVRMILHEVILGIVFHPRRWSLVALYQRLLAGTELFECLLVLRERGVPVLAISGSKDNLSFEGHQRLAEDHGWVKVIKGRSHLSLSVDGRFQAQVTKRPLSIRTL